MNLPLPLELTAPVQLATDLDAQVREGLNDTYDTKAQMCSQTHSQGRSNTFTALGGIQVDVTDVVVDDVIA